MSSPFPGMDPYLENPRYFPNFHNRFIVHLEEAIQPTLPSPYYAKTEERVWIEWPERSIIPDFNVVRRSNHPRQDDACVVAVLEEATVDTEFVRLEEGLEIHENTLNLYAGDPGEPAELVTALELLSPSNKTSGDGRTSYLRKQAEILERHVHFIEMDFLRGGEHATTIPRRLLKRPFDYHIAVRDLNRPEGELYSYPILLEHALPRIAVPLRPGDGYVTIDLQTVFDRCYDTGPYRREVRYDVDPPPPRLSNERLSWVRERIERWRNTSQS